MGKLFVVMGKSASGKDTLYSLLMERHPELRRVVPYTTRPIRSGETNGKEYHFVTEEELLLMKEKNKVVECRCYHTVHGPWYYFTADDGQIDFSKADYCLISTLEGYMGIRDFYGEENVVPLYIEVGDFERIRRSLQREKQQSNPCVAEVCRRFLADEEDFCKEKLAKAGILHPILNLDVENALRVMEEYIQGGHM